MGSRRGVLRSPVVGSAYNNAEGDRVMGLQCFYRNSMGWTISLGGFVALAVTVTLSCAPSIEGSRSDESMDADIGSHHARSETASPHSSSSASPPSSSLSSTPSSSSSFTEFESGQVRPLALSPDKQHLFAVNTPDNRLEIFRVKTNRLIHTASIPVGLEPVAVAARTDH